MSNAKDHLMEQLDASDPVFLKALERKTRLPEDNNISVRAAVADIISEVRRKGDAALLEFTQKFDGREFANVEDLEISREETEAACEQIEPLVLDALKASISRVREYHQKQKETLAGQASWSYEDSSGNSLGQRVRAIEKVGIYVPGGKASYPSSVVMTAIPAKVAEVEEVILVSPSSSQRPDALLLAAAHLCAVDRFFMLGGAQAIAALAYGTETVPKVDKIVGPGNIYVATAKSLVFGDVGIDMIAGPSEVVVIADQTANVEWLAMDLFAQAEHDELAQSIIISPHADLLKQVSWQLDSKLKGMQRSDIIRQSLSDRGCMVLTKDLHQAVQIANQLAPEHLQLAVADPESLLADIKHAGAIFLGHHSAEVVGDYTAGPSHVLPTNGAARYSSPLGIYDFQVRSSVIQCSREGAVQLSRDAAIIAREEGLEAHALAAEFRCQG